MTDPARRDPAAVNRIFGEELPQASGDERDTGDAPDAEARERWLRDNVPPHHI